MVTSGSLFSTHKLPVGGHSHYIAVSSDLDGRILSKQLSSYFCGHKEKNRTALLRLDSVHKYHVSIEKYDIIIRVFLSEKCDFLLFLCCQLAFPLHRVDPASGGWIHTVLFIVLDCFFPSVITPVHNKELFISLSPDCYFRISDAFGYVWLCHDRQKSASPSN